MRGFWQLSRLLATQRGGTRCATSFKSVSEMHMYDHKIPLTLAPPSDAHRLRERASAILWVKTQMAKHGITIDGLLAAGCFAAPRSSASTPPFLPVFYRDADGHTWNGEGNLPEWLQRAVNAGQSPEFFKVS